ncbi:MAG: CheR family methyltransferase [Aquabacterium sp.]
MLKLSKKAFDSVTALFHSVSGIRLTEQKQALVAGRLQKLAQEAGEPDLERYVDRLMSGGTPAEEMARVIDRLTTNETYFFREPQHFNHLSAHLRNLPTGTDVRAWSAASSSGEEAYSTAMLMADVLGNAPWGIWGTDLSHSVVASAQRGLYPLERARMVPPDYLKRFCLKGQGEHDGQLLVAKTLRQRVQFIQANLMQPLPRELPTFDVVFLRNVLIYFDNDAKAQIVRRVLGQLKPDGLLYIGHAESMASLNLPIRPLGVAIYTHA